MVKNKVMKKTKFKAGNIVVVKERDKAVYLDCFESGDILECLEEESFKGEELTISLMNEKYSQELHPTEIELIANKL